MSRAGKLDQRITFKQVSRSEDDMGGAVRAWVDIADTPTVWAGVKAVRGGERVSADRVAADAGYLFTVRNRSDIDARNAIDWKGRRFNIRFIGELSSRPLYMVIEADQGVAV